MQSTRTAELTVRGLFAATVGAVVLACGIAVVALGIGLIAMYVPVYVLSLSMREYVAGVFLIGTPVAVFGFVRVLPRVISEERRQLLVQTDSVEETPLPKATAAERRLGRLATQFDVPTPELRIHLESTPLAYTTYRPDDPLMRQAVWIVRSSFSAGASSSRSPRTNSTRS